MTKTASAAPQNSFSNRSISNPILQCRWVEQRPKLVHAFMDSYFPAESGEPSPYETKPFFPSELAEGDRDFTLLSRFGDREASGERLCIGGGDLDLDPDRLLLLDIERERSPCDLSFPPAGERLRTGLLLRPPPLPLSR
uniref:Uncharacterized protein n=1 Tax=Oryza glumipatula TaxID=40148 RepID=A0A0D9YNZ3_9ORYZ